MNFFTKNIAYIAIATMVFVVGIFVFLPAAPSVDESQDAFVSSANAATSCGSCDDGGTTGGGDSDDGGDTIYVYPPTCDITASVSVASDGEEYTVYWDGEAYGASYEVNGYPVTIPGSATYTFDGDYDYDRYVLYGVNQDGECSDEVVITKKVEEVPTPVCTVFEANPSTIDLGETAELHFETQNAVNTTLVTPDGQKDYNKKGTVKVSPDETFTYTLIVHGEEEDVECTAKVKVVQPTPAPTCDSFTAAPATIDKGEQTTLTWETTNADYVILRKSSGDETLNADDSRTLKPGKSVTYTLDVYGAGGHTDCEVPVTVVQPVDAPVCEITVSPMTLNKGESATLSWSSTNADTAVLEKPFNTTNVNPTGNTSVNPSVDSDYVLTVSNGTDSYECEAHLTVKQPTTPSPELPTCTFFAEDDSITKGDSTTLVWTTTNADSVVLEKPYNETNVQANSSLVVSPTATADYTLVATNAVGSVECPETVNVTNPGTPNAPAPTCTLDISPNTVTKGDSVNYTWTSTNAVELIVEGTDGYSEPDFIQWGENGTDSFTPTEDAVYTMTAVNADGVEVTCDDVVDVETVSPPNNNDLNCVDDVDFTASDTSVEEGERVTLFWSVSGDVYDVSINHGIGDVSRNGDEEVTINDDITYYITISNQDDSEQCPLSINAYEDNNGGGSSGGGSSRPKCELDISDDSITRGEEVNLKWETSNATEVTITDSDGNIIMTTDDYLSDDKKDYYDDDIDVKPLDDTTYTLVAERGSKEEECRVSVDVNGDGVTVTEVRSQTPTVAGISLTQVPYTGFDAGPALTVIFYTVLALWALYVAYVFVIRRNSFAGSSYAETAVHPYQGEYVEASGNIAADTDATQAQMYVAATAAPTAVAPHNLPTATAAETPVIGYAALATEEAATDEVNEYAELENVAHEHKTLLSTDVMRFLSASYGEQATEVLVALIAKAKVTLPTEDGWLVLNQARVENLLEETTTEEAPVVTDVPVAAPIATEVTPSGSLAEAMVTGNIAAAYQLIGNRPMVALAAAASDFDAIYRLRKGESATASDLLVNETRSLTDDQIKSAIDALTSALDGTYSSEAEAVKMAIMKATKALA